MIQYYLSCGNKPYRQLCLLLAILLNLQLATLPSQAQSCPATGSDTIHVFPNTYFPGITATLNAGSTSVTVGPAGYGSTAIASGDLLLLIQMQGVEIGYANDSSYGKGFNDGSSVGGYINNAQNLAGNMEYVVATNNVGTGGGTIQLLSPTVKDYKSAAFTGGYGQYTYQVIRVATYYNLTLGSGVDVPHWNGATGGVMAIYVSDNLNMNNKTIDGTAAGFRGGGGIALTGVTGGSASDFRRLSTSSYSSAKGEGIAGTPRYVNNDGILIDYGNTQEGYPEGCMGMGAPGNAGGGGTQSNKHTANTDNAGGGGGSNGSTGGKGGNSWSSNLPVGGAYGAPFAQVSSSRVVMGGGGGAGCNDDGTGTPAGGMASSGGAGGGIVILYATSVTGTGSIDVSGGSGYTTVDNDASGGGGAGGSVIIAANSGLTGITVTADGGTGGSNSGKKLSAGTFSPHGPGGGGGGGVIFTNGVLNGASSTSGGASGTTYGDIPYGAAPGLPSSFLMQHQLILSPMSCAVLSLNFVSVAATEKDQMVSVRWTVAHETDVEQYIIERSTDGRHFAPAGIQPRHFYEDRDSSEYQFLDVLHLTSNAVCYRVKAVTTQGAFTYSAITKIVRPAEAGTAFVSPNPVHATALFNLVSSTNGQVAMTLLDNCGRTCWHQCFAVTQGNNVLPLQGLEKLNNGIYLLRYDIAGNVHHIKLLIQH